MSDNMLIAGIDGGGTRSELVLITPEGKIVNRYTGNSLQALRLTEQQLSDNLHHLFDQCTTKERDQLIQLGAGLAGAHASQTHDRILPLLSLASGLEHERIHLYSDVEAAHIGAFSNTDGIMVILGTGSVALGRCKDTWKIVGGYGYKLGDEASGFDLGKLLLQLVARHLDGIHDYPEIIELLTSKVGTSTPFSDRSSFIHWIYDQKPDFATFAPLFLNLCETDKQYQLLLHRRIDRFLESLQSLTLMFNANSDSSIPVSLAGGLMKNTFFKSTFKERILHRYPMLSIHAANHDAAVGLALAIADQNNY